MSTPLFTDSIMPWAINPRHVTQRMRIFCDAQYRERASTTVLGRIRMMRKLGRAGRRRLTKSEQWSYERSLGLTFQECLELRHRAKRDR